MMKFAFTTHPNAMTNTNLEQEARASALQCQEHAKKVLSDTDYILYLAFVGEVTRMSCFVPPKVWFESVATFNKMVTDYEKFNATTTPQ